MITVSVSKLVGDAFGKGGYADKLIALKGYPFLDHRSNEIIGLLSKDIMTPITRLTCLKATGVSLGDISNF
jgi:chloride channel 3/4/5